MSRSSSTTSGGSTTYSFIGRPPIGSNRCAPSSFNAAARSASLSRTNIELPKSPVNRLPPAKPAGCPNISRRSPRAFASSASKCSTNAFGGLGIFITPSIDERLERPAGALRRRRHRRIPRQRQERRHRQRRLGGMDQRQLGLDLVDVAPALA